MTAQPLSPAATSAVNGAGKSAWFGWLVSAMETAALVSGNWPLRPNPGPRGWTCFPRVATRTPGLDARAIRDARDFAVATAQRWDAAERCEDIAVVVSELLTNALRHAAPDSGEGQACGRIRLGLLHLGPCVLCAVADTSQQPPVPQDRGPLAETGRGLHVISALSDNWGYATLGDLGKVVWAMFSTTPRVWLAGR